MSVKNFIPTLWSARLQANLDNKLSGMQFVNTDYEGEIKAMGDTVHINQMGSVTIKDYDGSDIEAADDLTSEQQTLKITEGDYFNIRVKDVDATQANVTLIDKGMQRAAYGMGDKQDKFIFGELAKEGTDLGSVEITPQNAYDTLIDMGTKLDEANVPKVNRKVAIPFWFLGVLSKDNRFTHNYTVLENGVVDGATVGGFTLVATNNLPGEPGSETIIANHPMSTTFAKQLVETEAYRPENNFADAVKGLQVYGIKTIEKAAIVKAAIKKAAAE